MISEIKKAIKNKLPGPLFDILVSLYRFTLFYPVLLFRSFYLFLFFRKKTIITLKETALKLVVNPKNGYTDRMLFLFKERDIDLIKFMRQNVQPTDTIVDIGANIGYETIWGASLVPQGRVYSFEPLPNLVKQIEESIHTNGFTNVELKNKAVGNTSGEITLFLNPKDAGLTSARSKEGATSTAQVPIIKLDEELKNIGAISFIKMDIEGHEFDAFLGAKTLLEKYHPTIVFEFSPHLYELDYPGKSKELLKFLIQLDYAIYVLGTQEKIKNEDSALETFIQHTIKKGGHSDIIASVNK